MLVKIKWRLTEELDAESCQNTHGDDRDRKEQSRHAQASHAKTSVGRKRHDADAKHQEWRVEYPTDELREDDELRWRLSGAQDKKDHQNGAEVSTLKELLRSSHVSLVVPFDRARRYHEVGTHAAGRC